MRENSVEPFRSLLEQAWREEQQTSGPRPLPDPLDRVPGQITNPRLRGSDERPGRVATVPFSRKGRRERVTRITPFDLEALTDPNRRRRPAATVATAAQRSATTRISRLRYEAVNVLIDAAHVVSDTDASRARVLLRAAASLKPENRL